MKANEVPEKLYFGELDKGVLDIYSTKESDNEVEYIRIDAFIEKACKFISDRVYIPFNVECSNGEPLADSYSEYLLARLEAVNKIIEDFRKYMKGE